MGMRKCTAGVARRRRADGEFAAYLLSVWRLCFVDFIAAGYPADR